MALVMPYRQTALSFWLWLLTASLTFAQNPTIDSLKRVLATELADDSRLFTLQYISAEYWKMDIDTAILYSEEVLQLAQEMDYERGIGNAYILLGASYTYLGSYPLALDYLYQALAIYEKQEDREGIAIALENIGILFVEQGQYQKALVHFDSCLVIKKENHDTYGQGDIYSSMGSLYLRMGELSNAVSALSKGLNIWKDLRIYHRWGETENLIANTYLNQGRVEEAKTLFTHAKQLSDSIGNKGDLAISYQGLAECALAEGDFALAKAHGLTSYQLQTEVGGFSELVANYELLIAIEKALENKSKAFDYAELLMKAKDSVFNEEKVKAIAELEALQRFDQLEKERALVKQRDKSRLLLYRTITTTVVVGLVVLCIVGFRGYRIKSRANIRISQQRDEIQSQNKQLQSLNSIKDKVFSIIAHDLRSPINSLEALLSLVNATQGSVSKEELSGIFGRISKNVHGVSTLLNNLLYWGRSQMEGEATLRPELLSLNTYLIEAIQVLEEVMKGKQIEIQVELDEAAHSVWADPEVLRLVIRNLLNNAIKFSHSASSVEIRSEAEGSQTKLWVVDHGIGMDEATKNSLFRGYVDSQRGTGSEKGTGLGLMLSYEFTVKSGGGMGVNSELGRGSQFWFTLPTSEPKA